MLKFHIKQQRVSRNILKLHSQLQSSRIVAESCLPYSFRSQEVFEFKAVRASKVQELLSRIEVSSVTAPSSWEEPASLPRKPMREPEEHMWEVASLEACHSLHILSVTEVPNRPWCEAHGRIIVRFQASLGEQRGIQRLRPT